LDATLGFSEITFPSGILVFSAGSGEVVGYTEALNTISLSDESDGLTKIITVNQYGVPTTLN
jgi:hypothetical protein